jgi:GNAT superfamily N-acetyltransferase
MPVVIQQAESPEQIAQIRELFLEYAKWLGFSLCFQGFDQELASLPGRYAPPSGRLFLAMVDGAPAGCIGLRAMEPDVCEMKRLYVRPQFRGHQLGRVLIQKLLDEARVIGYARMQLDTIPGQMDRAIALYREFGFQEITPREDLHPVAGTIWMAKDL